MPVAHHTLPHTLRSDFVLQVFLDVRVEGENIGRIVVELLGDAGVAGQRFADLAEGKQGVGYRLSKFDGIYSVSCCLYAVLQVMLMLKLPADKKATWPGAARATWSVAAAGVVQQ